MLNVNQITSELARLPDNALQRYAMMHKDDPYVLSLAMSESNRRKEMRAGAQGHAAPQPTVAQQAVAGMAPQAQLPEQVGIGTLPAQNVAHMADGGIAGYAEGGPNPASGPAGQLAYNNEPVLRMAGGGMVALKDGGVAHFDGTAGSVVKDSDVQAVLQKDPQGRTAEDNALLEKAGYKLERQTVPANSGISAINSYLQSLGPNIRNYFTAGASNLSDAELANRPNVGGAMNERILRSLGIEPSATPPGPQASYSLEGRRTPAANAGIADIAQPNAPESALPKRPPVKQAPTNTPGITAAAPAATAATTAAPAMDPIAYAKNLRKGIYGEEQPIETRAQFLAAQKEFTGESPYAAQMARLAKLDERAAAEKSDAVNNALLTMGLTMMRAPATGGGKLSGLLSGVGSGGEAGLQSLTAAMKDIRAAERDREKMRMEIERGQYAEKLGQWDKAQGHYEKAQELKARGNEHTMSAAASMAVTQEQGKTNREIAAGHDAATIQAAKIRSQDQKEYLAELRGGSMIETAKKNIRDAIQKANPYADEATRARLFDAEWQKALQTNPALAKYAGVASGGGGASSGDPLGLR